MKDITINGRAWRRGSGALLADGAWGTEFLRRGLVLGDPPEAWNLEKPETVLEVARGYVRAGSDIILTNSFGGSRFQLERHGLAASRAEINRKAAELSVLAAREAAAAPAAAGGGRRVIVAGDMGPSGKLFVMGEVPESELHAAFAEQAEALAAGGAEWLVVETMSDLGEMEVAVRAAAATGLPVVASMTYDRNPSGYRTMMGHAPEDCVRAAEAAGAALVGANCGGGIDAYVELAAILRGLTSLPLWIKANAGLPEILDGRAVYRMTAAGYCSYLPALLNAGVDVVGGCCGTDPGFVAAMRKVLDERG